MTSASPGQRSRTASSIAPACWWAEGSGSSPGRLTVTSATRPCSPSRKLTASGDDPVKRRTADSMASRSTAVSSVSGERAQSVRASGSMWVCT